MRIRRATVDDAEAVTALILRCSEIFILPEFSDEGREIYRRTRSVEAVAKLIESGLYWVAEDHSRIRGVVGLESRNHLYHLHVDPDFHRRGLATRLWRTCLSMAAPRITVNASRYAIPFYETLGFTMVGERASKGVIYFAMVLDRTLQFDF